MSRSNPYKKKKRAAKRTILFFGEGLREEIFLKHLRDLYARDSGISVKIKKGRGGSADKVVKDARNIDGAFDLKVVVLDCDKKQFEMCKARKLVRANRIQLIENQPCLEALFLEILQNNKKFQNRSSESCKREFKNNYIPKKERQNREKYKQVFPKEIIERKRGQIKNLEIIIKIIEGK